MLLQDPGDPLSQVETMLSITGSKCEGEKWKNCNGVYQLSNRINPIDPNMALFKHIYDDFYLFWIDFKSGWCLAHAIGSLSAATCIESDFSVQSFPKHYSSVIVFQDNDNVFNGIYSVMTDKDLPCKFQ